MYHPWNLNVTHDAIFLSPGCFFKEGPESAVNLLICHTFITALLAVHFQVLVRLFQLLWRCQQLVPPVFPQTNFLILKHCPLPMALLWGCISGGILSSKMGTMGQGWCHRDGRMAGWVGKWMERSEGGRQEHGKNVWKSSGKTYMARLGCYTAHIK